MLNQSALFQIEKNNGLSTKNEMTMKEESFSFFSTDTQERKAESQPIFGTLPFAYNAIQRFVKVKGPNFAFASNNCNYIHNNPLNLHMKKILLFVAFFGFAVLFCNAQIAKKEPMLFQKNSISNNTTHQVNELPDRSILKKLSESNHTFDLKKKVNIDGEKHWYALENEKNEIYWNNVNCNKLIIEFQKDYSPENSDVKNFLQKTSLSKVIEKSMFPEIQNFYVFEITNSDKSKVLSIIKYAKEFDFVINAEPVAIFKKSLCQPNDPYYSQQWGPYVMYADSVWCYFTGGSKNWLAVIDDAVDWYHEDLYDAVWYGYDFGMNDADPTPDNDNQEHGTHVTGTVGATINNGMGVAGMLVDTIYFAKVSDNNSTLSNTGIVNAINSIASNPKIRVINMSLGAYSQNSALETALQNAYNNGKLLIAAAGNDAVSNPMYPAAYNVVISVSAVGVDAGGNLTDASYSNYGSTIDVSAPGGGSSTEYQIMSTLPSNNYGGMQGTSMASPHVTGVAGLVFAINPLLTNTQARSIIEQQVFDLGTTGWDPLFGSGMVCAWCAFEEACNQLSINISAGGSTTFCSGGSVTLNGVNNSGISYQWQKNGIDISGAISNSYTVTQGGTYSLKIQTLGGVCEAYSNSIVITVNSLPASAGAISGTATVCQGQNSVSYTVPTIANATSYIWTLPSGAMGTSSTNSITVNYGISAISGNITVKGNNTCGVGTTSTLPITINVLPQNAGSITGTTTVCQGQSSVSYTVPTIANATSYIWTLPSGTTGTSSTNSINVNYGTSAVSGNITVKGNNTCGVGTTSTLPITINVLPQNAGSITGTTTVCQGQSFVTYTVPTIPYANSYVWSLPSGATGTSSTNSINVNFSTSAVSGNITVKGNNTCGDGATANLPITINVLPQNAGSITGTTTVCQGQSSVTYTVPTIPYANSYVWSLPSGATGTSSTNSINVNFSTSAVSGNITVKGNNTCGDGTTASLSITVNSKPPTPIISLIGYVLHSDAPIDNQWYDQTGPIAGATNQEYTVTVDGDYYVIVSSLGCSSDPSNTINVMVTGIELVDDSKVIKVYPNPVSNELTIEIEGNSDKLDFEILNAIGQVVFKGNFIEKTTLHTTNFAPGVYLIKLENGKTFEFKKIIKE